MYICNLKIPLNENRERNLLNQLKLIHTKLPLMPKSIALPEPLHLIGNDDRHGLTHIIALHHWTFGQYAHGSV